METKGRGRKLERKVVRGSERMGTVVKHGVERAGTKIGRGARTVGRDAKGLGKRLGRATRRGLTGADNRLRSARRGKTGAR